MAFSHDISLFFFLAMRSLVTSVSGYYTFIPRTLAALHESVVVVVVVVE
jgi:hypothetical protein